MPILSFSARGRSFMKSRKRAGPRGCGECYLEKCGFRIVEWLVPSLVGEFIRLICFALVGKLLFKVFHRTLEFNLLLSISLITASFLAFFNKWYYFASSSIKRHSLDSPLFELFLEPIALFDRCENFIRKPRWFLHRFNSDWFKWSVPIHHIKLVLQHSAKGVEFGW